MDSGGKTVVHRHYCAQASCACPKRLAAATVKNLLGKLRAIFNARSRLDRQNPTSLPEVKRYVVFMREEQAAATVVPRQAIPFEPVKIERLVHPIQRYLVVRDITFFVIDFLTGDHASDLGRLQSHCVFQLANNGGFLLNFCFGKTLQGVHSLTRPFVLLPAPSLRIYPVFWFQYYLNYCRDMAISLHPGYVFRASTEQGWVSDQPFMSSAVYNRLRSHLLAVGLHSGETPDSFRTGVATTLSTLGFSVEDIASYVGWKSVASARQYSRPAAAAKLVAVFNTMVASVGVHDT